MDDWTSVALEEYKALHAKILQATQNQQSAVRLGALALSFLIGSAFTLSKTYASLACIELTLILPLTVLLVILMWFFNLYWITQLNGYTLMLEKEINSRIGQNAHGQDCLRWGEWSRERKVQHYFPYFAPIAGFLLLGILGMSVGYYIWYSKNLSSAIILSIIVGFLCILVAAIYFYYTIRMPSEYSPERDVSNRRYFPRHWKGHY
ncbi:MAG: hypothetical protein QMD05_00880 [Candidatus Brocadiaceae bacterium]|nr:hypothetical protein [Candidatus Brocadiaceae bacterium]